LNSIFSLNRVKRRPWGNLQFLFSDSLTAIVRERQETNAMPA